MQCIRIALLMISIVVQCNRNKSAMHWNKLLLLTIVVQCIRIALLMISIVVQCNIQINQQCIGINCFCKP